MTTPRSATAIAPLPRLSVIVPVYNEAEVLGELHRRLAAVLDALALPAEIVYVDDGSRDDSAARIAALRANDARVIPLVLSRNFGKEAAMTAGLDHARGDAVIVIDADLQDPPECIPQMVAQWQQGADVVLMRRSSRAGETWFKKWTARQFYRVIGRISTVGVHQDVGDFRLLSRRAADAVRQCRERTRFMKGLFAWAGFRQVVLTYDRDARHAGDTKWNYWRLWNFALEGITSFSTVPLRFATYVGFLTALSAFLFGVYVIVKTLLFGDPVHGFPTLAAIILFLGGIQLMALGVIGEYLGRVFVEVKQRPLYVLDDMRSALPRAAGPDARDA